jgi:2,2-dialkylglycine decarboxylase (pyruvate)
MAPFRHGTLDRQSGGVPADVIVEPIVSAGGVIELPVEYLQGLRKELDKRGALLIYDEAQTGLGKLGKMFAYQVNGVRPDVLTVSKHLGGGLAISAAITTDDVTARATRNGLSIGHSHSSDPLACKAGTASIDEIVEKDLPRRALEIGAHWQANLRRCSSATRSSATSVASGLMQGIELVRSAHQGARRLRPASIAIASQTG